MECVRVCVAAALGLTALVVVEPAAAQVQRLSVSTAGGQADGATDQPAVDHSGRFVAVRSVATNLVAGDTNGAADIVVRDRDTDGDGVFDEPGAVATTRVSLATGGTQANGASEAPALGADGRFVVFVSAATAATSCSRRWRRTWSRPIPGPAAASSCATWRRGRSSA